MYNLELWNRFLIKNSVVNCNVEFVAGNFYRFKNEGFLLEVFIMRYFNHLCLYITLRLYVFELDSINLFV